MTAATDANANTTVLVPGYDPAGHQDRVAFKVVNVTTDNSVSPAVTYGDLNIGGTVTSAPSNATTATKSNVSGSATSVTILPSNMSRKGATIYNDSTAILYLDLSGGTASTTSYSVQIPSNGFYELPPPSIYLGVITGIWSSATGAARVTELS